MKEICVPIPDITEDEIAEVVVNVRGRRITYNYRIESFPWKADNILEPYDDIPTLSSSRINELRRYIESYDKEWELVQIFNPSEVASHIHVMYRRKKT